MKRLFAVIRSRGPSWDDARPMEHQVDRATQAAFMEGLIDDQFVALGGRLEGTRDVLLVVRAANVSEIADRLAADPWTQHGLLIVTQTHPWSIRLGSLA